MSLNGNDLADALKDSLGFSAEATSDKNKDMAIAIVDHLKTGIVSHLVVDGIAPSSGGSLSDGEALLGTILLVPVDLGAAFVSAFGVSTPQIITFGVAVSTHVLTQGKVNFEKGKITGICGNTPTSPGPVVGEGADGTIDGLSGTVLATAVSAALGQPTVSPQLANFCNVLVNYIMDNAECSYDTGTVTGTASAGGGPIVAVGAGGSIA